jgi:tetratricopeptide (TPR) repeat protein
VPSLATGAWARCVPKRLNWHHDGIIDVALMAVEGCERYTDRVKEPRPPAPYRDLSDLLRETGSIDREGAQTEQARARVVRALATFERAGRTRVQAERVGRQFAIITRCDLGGQLHKVVAADLGISMRTFYRERAEGFERLREALGKDRFEAHDVPQAPSPLALRLERARMLGARGKLSEAIASLHDLGSSESDPAVAAIAQARVASLWRRRGLAHESDDALARARRSAARLGNGAPHTVAEAEIQLADAHRLRAAGRFASAAGAAARIAGSMSLRWAHATPSGIEAVRAAMALHLEVLLEQGAAAQALSVAADAKVLLPVDDRCPVDTLLDLALGLAEAQFIVDGDCTSALLAATEAHAKATDAGLTRHAVRALRLIGLVYGILGDRSVGAGYVKSALQMAASSLSGDDLRSAALDLAAASVDLADAQGAAAAFESAGSFDEADGLLAAVWVLRNAELLVVEGRYRDAAVRAREAVRLLGQFDSRRLSGEAALAVARALHGCGEVRPARSMAAEASEHLRGTSWPSRAIDALDLAGRREIGLRLRLERHHLPAVRRLNAS